MYAEWSRLVLEDDSIICGKMAERMDGFVDAFPGLMFPRRTVLVGT